MVRFDQSTARCRIFTYKEGLLSPFAHDLLIDVGSFAIELAGESMINARFDTGSLRVCCAIVGGQERSDLLSDSDRKDIEKTIREGVLQTGTYREIAFRSRSVAKEDSTYLVRGDLSLHGAEKEITFSVRLEGSDRVAEARLHLPDYGIKPFSALFGAVRIKPDILIRVTLPGERGPAG
ncbi:MAG: YceI family protein [Nitrospiraceae bacterium]|nr:YceI family protein [Nitrospiraceae bacterium]